MRPNKLALLLFALFPLPSAFLLTPPAQAASLTPTDSIGNVRQYSDSDFLYISSNSRAISSVNAFLGFQMPYGLRGSAAAFNLAPGTYTMNWRLQTNVNDTSDELFLWNGSLMALASSSEAYTPHETDSEGFVLNRTVTDWTTTTFESFGRIYLIAIDGNKQYDTTLKLASIERVNAVPEPFTVGGWLIGGLFLLQRRSRKA